MNNTVDKQIVTLQHLDVEYVAIETISPNAYNPNRQSDRDFELLCRSIEEDGFTQPIIVQRDTNTIVDGEHRWRACRALGMTEIPVVYVSMTDAQRLISTLRHNRARGSENLSLVADVLKGLQDTGALDAAADSLMMDDIEIEIMLEDIPMAEINLRNEGEKLSADEVAAKNKQEHDMELQAKRDLKRNIKEERSSTLAITFKMTRQELELVNTAFNSTGETEKNTQLVALLNLYPDWQP